MQICLDIAALALVNMIEIQNQLKGTEGEANFNGHQLYDGHSESVSSMMSLSFGEHGRL